MIGQILLKLIVWKYYWLTKLAKKNHNLAIFTCQPCGGISSHVSPRNCLHMIEHSSATSACAIFFILHTDSTKKRFSVAYSFSRKERKWSRPTGSRRRSQQLKPQRRTRRSASCNTKELNVCYTYTGFLFFCG